MAITSTVLRVDGTRIANNLQRINWPMGVMIVTTNQDISETSSEKFLFQVS